ncbi:hypothetical protein L198_07334 [Cryptococcus wingfieldii CBS 7118]|uniref:Major facilitator superfamily (MFS) profile domain-containing protein n=1 Tax=Cryptococcus wingfieldii CBS 7118 TaxID=1295528 RepID=A0A1E3IEF7_9TREE|nr:hypothetical protein L198_07334 [Cryptococcus wingfieldii CBS 7118]ODN86316.1 hypothetical protein L198_07334 [Cryptococcus wingfieldii CBS 7118]
MASIFWKLKHELFLSDPTWDRERREEKGVVRRLDIFFESYIILSAIVKYLDQRNISNAYVSGMKEDLSLYGNELNFFTTYFNIGYLIVIPISTYVINSVVRPSIWLPTLELLWGIFTGTLAAAKSAKTIYGIRFLIGFCEGTAWPGILVLLLSWYTPAEIGLRLAIYESASYVGAIFAGGLQAALYTKLNGNGGLAGWQWLFIINAIITVTVATWGYFGCPDYPNKPNPMGKWLQHRHVKVAMRRMGNQGRAMPVGWNWGTVKSLVSRPQNWAIWAGYTIYGQAGSGVGYFSLWLKSLKNDDGSARYTVSQVNTIPIAVSCLNIISLLVILGISDRFRVQWPFILICAVNGLVWSSVLAGWNVPDALKMASFLMLSISVPGANLFAAWVGTLAKHSAEERSAIIAAFLTTYYAITAGAPLKIWPASEAPHYRIGWTYASAMWAAVIPIVLLIVYLERRQRRIDDRCEIELQVGDNGLDVQSNEVVESKVIESRDNEKYGIDKDVLRGEAISVLEDHGVSGESSRVWEERSSAGRVLAEPRRG